MAKWAAVIVAVLKLLSDILSAKKVTEAKDAGRAEAALDALNQARRSIEKAREIEAQAAVRHAADATDGAFDKRFRRDE